MLVALSDVGGTLMDVVPNYTHSAEAWGCGNPCPLLWNALLQRASATVECFFFFLKVTQEMLGLGCVCWHAHLIWEEVLGPWGRRYMVYKDCVLNLTTPKRLETSSWSGEMEHLKRH